MLIVAAGLCFAAANVGAQSAPAPAQSDNPFPGETQKAPAKPAATKAAPAPTAPTGDNPFPGEDTNAPIIPVDGQPAASQPNSPSGADSGAKDQGQPNGGSARRDADPDGDPVRTPDPAGLNENDGFSSSRSGLPSNLPAEDDSDAKPGKSIKNKTREQLIQEDLDVAGFYAEKRDWRAALTRYQAAFGLDNQNPDAVYGLAEAERRLHMNVQAAEHFRLFLSYDPDGPHSKAARRGLDEVEAARPVSGNAAKNAAPGGASPR